ncbi:MAG: FAD-dependent oxidoreductase, partial [Pseudomonadota bacterium]
MTDRYSAWRLLREGLRSAPAWQPAWRRKPAPDSHYDAVVIGGGGHGLATAYYLAKNHGMRRVALVEKGWLGGGNTGRNTTAVRSNYFFPESVALYDLALRLYEGLSDELNYNVMLSQRGMLIAAHTPMQMEICTRIANAMRLNGVDGDLMTREQALKRLPLLNQTADARYQCQGGIWQGRAGVARHDAVAWGYARAASALGIDIIENCAVTGLDVTDGAVSGVQTARGAIRTERVGIAAAGATPGLAALVDVALPTRSVRIAPRAVCTPETAPSVTSSPVTAQ